MLLTTSAMDYCCYLSEEAEYQDGGGISQLSAVELAEEHSRNQESFPLFRPDGNQSLPIHYKGAMRQRNLNWQSRSRPEEGIINMQRNHLEKLTG